MCGERRLQNEPPLVLARQGQFVLVTSEPLRDIKWGGKTSGSKNEPCEQDFLVLGWKESCASSLRLTETRELSSVAREHAAESMFCGWEGNVRRQSEREGNGCHPVEEKNQYEQQRRQMLSH